MGKRHTSMTPPLSSFFSIMEIELLRERTVTWMKGNESTFIKYHQDPPVHGDGSNFPSWPCHIRLTLSEILHCVCSSPATNDLWLSADQQHPDVVSVCKCTGNLFTDDALLHAVSHSLTSVAISHIAFWLTLCDTHDTSDPKGWNWLLS